MDKIMDAVKIQLYQNMVNYRKEMSFGYVQTYPLPTPSMVKGMAHNLLKLDKFYNLKISIQGNYESVATNMQKVIKFDRERKARPTNPYDVTIYNSKKTAKHGVMYVDELVNMKLILHVSFEDSKLNDNLLKAVKQETIVLGRNEDIARVDFEKTKLVALNKRDDDFALPNNIFLPVKKAKEAFLSGTQFHLPFYYYPVTSFKDKRIFKFVDAMFVAKDSILEDVEYLIDDDGDMASFLCVDTNE